MTESPSIVLPPAVAEDAPALPLENTDAPKKPRLDPTRYGDWELNGKCVDF